MLQAGFVRGVSDFSAKCDGTDYNRATISFGKNMKTFKIASVGLITFSALLLSATASAKWIQGSGSDKCATWTQFYAPQAKANGMQIWVQGYISGVNVTSAGPDFYEKSDNQAIDMAINTYCKDKPFDPLVKATDFVIQMLKDKAK